MYDVPSGTSADRLTDMICEQDFEGEMSVNEFQLLFKTAPKNKFTVHHVCEVSGKLRKTLLGQDIGDYTVVPRNLKCQELEHVEKHCDQRDSVWKFRRTKKVTRTYA